MLVKKESVYFTYNYSTKGDYRGIEIKERKGIERERKPIKGKGEI